MLFSTLALLSTATGLVAAAPASSSSASASTPASATTSSTSVSPSASALASNSTSGSVDGTTTADLTAQGLQVFNGSGPHGLHNAKCQDVTLTVQSNSSNIAFQDVPQTTLNQTYLSQTLLQYINFKQNYTSAHMNGSMVQNNKTYQIHGQYCSPEKGQVDSSRLLVAVHGVGFDSSYWDYSLAPEYSFTRRAASFGYPTFIYDRLGCGKSETPENGFDEVQVNTEIAILENVVQQIKTSNVVGGKSWSNVTGIGHSYGSIQVQAVSSQSPDLFEGVVLTGFSTNSQGLATFVAGGDFTIARNTVSGLSNKPTEWIAGGSKAALITQFLSPIFNTFSQDSLDLAFKTEQAVTLGSLFTQGSGAAPAKNFTGPVFVIDGKQDLPFCNSDCSATTNGSTIPEQVKKLYPVARNFTTSIVENSGHGLTIGYSAADAYQQVMEFIVSNQL